MHEMGHVILNTWGETFDTSGNMTWEKLSWPTRYAKATVLGYRLKCLLAAPYSETNQKQQNPLLWPFPCPEIPVPNANERICQSSCVWSLMEGHSPTGAEKVVQLRGSTRNSRSQSLPFNTWAWQVCREPWTKIRNVKYPKLMATSVL